jgi:hypothetical protein
MYDFFCGPDGSEAREPKGPQLQPGADHQIRNHQPPEPADRPVVPTFLQSGSHQDRQSKRSFLLIEAIECIHHRPPPPPQKKAEMSLGYSATEFRSHGQLRGQIYESVSPGIKINIIFGDFEQLTAHNSSIFLKKMLGFFCASIAAF